MPPSKPTWAQDEYGTGPQAQPKGYIPPSGGGSLGTSPSLGANPYDTANQFHAAYGGLPAHRVLAMTQEGQPPQAWGAGMARATAPTSPASATNAATNPATTIEPAQAGNINAAMPGAFNGNLETGISKEQAGFTPPPPPPQDMKRTPMWAQEGGAPPVPGSGPTKTAGETPSWATMDAPKAAVAMPAQTAAAAGTMPVDTQEAAAPPPPATAGAGEAPVQTASATSAPAQTQEAAPAPPVQSGTTQTKNFDGVSYSLTKPLPGNFQQWDRQRQRTWLQTNATPVSSGQAAAETALDKTNMGDMKLPTTPPLTTPAYFNLTTDPLDIARSVADPTLRTLIGRAIGMKQQLEQSYNVNGTATKDTEKLTANYLAIENALKAYNINIGTKPAEPAPGGGGTTPIPNPTAPPASPDGDGTVAQPTDGSSGGVADWMKGTALDLSNVSPASQANDFNKLVSGYLKQGMSPEQAYLMAEGAFSAARMQDQTNNQQNAVTQYGGALRQFENSPLYKGLTDIGQSMIDKPDMTDWETIKNQRSTDVAKAGEQAIQNVSVGANRRGIAPGAMAGMAADIGQQTGNEQARSQGEISIAQGDAANRARQNALTGVNQALGGTYGASMGYNSNLANLIAGNPSQYGNPYEGLTSGYVNIKAAQEAADAADAAGDFGWSDAIQIAGIVAAPFTGGLSLMASGAAGAAQNFVKGPNGQPMPNSQARRIA